MIKHILVVKLLQNEFYFNVCVCVCVCVCVWERQNRIMLKKCANLFSFDSVELLLNTFKKKEEKNLSCPWYSEFKKLLNW